MKCNRCADVKKTVGELRGCPACATDGTAKQLGNFPDEATIESVLHEHPGIGNRFLPCADEIAEVATAQNDSATAATAAAESAPKKSKKAKAKPAAKKKPTKLKRKLPPPRACKVPSKKKAKKAR